MTFINKIGKYIPSERIDNIARGKSLGLDSHFILNKVGFKTLAVRSKDETVLDMAFHAVQDLLKEEPKALENLSLLVCVGQIRDTLMPHMSACLHERLNLGGETVCIDIGQACAGYPYALEVVKSLMINENYSSAIVVTADSYRDIIDPANKTTAIVFGDAATASLITKKQKGFKINNLLLGTVSNSTQAVGYTVGSSLHHKPRYAFDTVINILPEKIREFQNSHENFDRILIHQGTKYIMDVLVKTCQFDPKKVPFNATEQGNTISSNVALLLYDELIENKAQNVLLCAFGAGLSWGLCSLRRT